MFTQENCIGGFTAEGYDPILVKLNPLSGEHYQFRIAEDNTIWLKSARMKEWEKVDHELIHKAFGPLDLFTKVKRFYIKSGPYSNEYVIDNQSVEENEHFPDIDAYWTWLLKIPAQLA